MNWNDVMNIRKAREQMHPNNTSDSPDPSKNRGINSPVLNDTEQLVFRMRAELIDYIVAHGLVDGLIWDGVIKKTENGKIVITAEMVNSMVNKLQFFKKEDVLKLLEVYLPENNYVQDENYVHTDNNFTDEEIARIDKAILDIIEIKEHEQECDETNRRKFEEIDGRLLWHDASIATISSQIAVITSSTIRQQGEIDEIEKVVGNHLKDYEMHLQDFNDHLEETTEKFNGINENMNSFREDLTDLEDRERVNEQNISSLILADADINRHMREIDDNHRKLTASTIILASEIHRVEDKVDVNERNNQREHEKLENRIQAEHERAVGKESEIEEKISMLTVSSIVADTKITALSEALADETKRATDAENALGDRIDKVTASSLVISGQISDIEEAIRRESEERKTADNGIKSSVATMSSAMAVLSSSVMINSSKIESIEEAISSTGTEIDAINSRLDTAEDSISSNSTIIQDHAERINRLEELARGGASIFALSNSPIKIDITGKSNDIGISDVSDGYTKLAIDIYDNNNQAAEITVSFYYTINEIINDTTGVIEVGIVDGLLNSSGGVVYGKALKTETTGEIQLLCSVITDERWTTISDDNISIDMKRATIEGLSASYYQIDSLGHEADISDGFYVVTAGIVCEYMVRNIVSDERIKLSGVMKKNGGEIQFISLNGCGEYYNSTVVVSASNNTTSHPNLNICITSYADSCRIVETITESFFKLEEKKNIKYVKLSNKLFDSNLNNELFEQIGNYRTSVIGISFSLTCGGEFIAKCYVQGTVIGARAESGGGHLVGELVGADESIANKTEKIMSLTVTMHGNEDGRETFLNISAIVEADGLPEDGGSGWDVSEFALLKIISNYVPIRINKKGATASDYVVNSLRNYFIFPGANETFIYYSNLVISFHIDSDTGEFVGKEISANVNGTMRISVQDNNELMYITSSYTTRTDYYEVGISPADEIGKRNLSIIYSEVSVSANARKDVSSLISELYLDALILSNGGTGYVVKDYKVINADFYKIN